MRLDVASRSSRVDNSSTQHFKRLDQVALCAFGADATSLFKDFNRLIVDIDASAFALACRAAAFVASFCLRSASRPDSSSSSSSLSDISLCGGNEPFAVWLSECRRGAWLAMGRTGARCTYAVFASWPRRCLFGDGSASESVRSRITVGGADEFVEFGDIFVVGELAVGDGVAREARMKRRGRASTAVAVNDSAKLNVETSVEAARFTSASPMCFAVTSTSFSSHVLTSAVGNDAAFLHFSEKLERRRRGVSCSHGPMFESLTLRTVRKEDARRLS